MVKTLFDYDDCLAKGLIKKTAPSKDKAKQSLLVAGKWFEEAVVNASGHALRSSLLSAYLAVFHAARAILFYDGYREKSHACIARYLEANYVSKGKLESKWVQMLDHLRETRHTDQYSFDFFTSSDEVEEALEKSKAFVARMKKLLDDKAKI
jgi:uncharacterized protein (UPF0332 family)